MILGSTYLMDVRLRENIGNRTLLIVLPLVCTVICTLLVIAVLKGRSWISTNTYINEALATGFSCLESHCTDTTFDDGTSIQRRCWVVEEAAGRKPSKIIGLIVVRVRVPPSRFNELGSASIEWLVVDKSFRRQGIAAALIHSAEEYSRSFTLASGQQLIPQQCAIVSSLQTEALSFYKQMGYVVDSTSSSSIFWERDFRVAKPLRQQQQ